MTPDPKATPARCRGCIELARFIRARDEKIATLERERGQAHDHIRQLMARIKELESR